MTVFWFLLYAQKERLRGERCLLCLCKRLRDADRREEIWYARGSRCAGAGLRLAQEHSAGRRKQCKDAMTNRHNMSEKKGV